MHPYLHFVRQYADLLHDGKRAPLGGFPPLDRPVTDRDSPRALIFSPHPDDECIIGALPLRLMREARFNVINIAVTQGSNRARQPERWAELKRACDFIGYGLIQTRPNGFEKINPHARQQDPVHWRGCVSVIAHLLRELAPSAIFFPHESDWNSTHIGTHWLVVDALASLGPAFECATLETEFWGASPCPNLMVESTPQEVADLVAGTSFHEGEVRRNPFHLFLPAWMQDNVPRERSGRGTGRGRAGFRFCDAL
jgi:N-acetylglucosamine malate deacetylase 1